MCWWDGARTKLLTKDKEYEEDFHFKVTVSYLIETAASTLTDNSDATWLVSRGGAGVAAGGIRAEKSPPPISRGRNPPTALLWF